MQEVSEWQTATPEEFRSAIIPRARPAVLRGLASNWPLVVIAKHDPLRLSVILSRSASESPVDILRADPPTGHRAHRLKRPPGRLSSTQTRRPAPTQSGHSSMAVTRAGGCLNRALFHLQRVRTPM